MKLLWNRNRLTDFMVPSGEGGGIAGEFGIHMYLHTFLSKGKK